MTTDSYLLLGMLLVLLAVALFGGWGYLTERRLGVRDRVVVNLLGGQAVTGVLWARRGPYVVLRTAALIEPGNTKPAPMDGEAVIHRDQVLLLQRLGR